MTLQGTPDMRYHSYVCRADTSYHCRPDCCVAYNVGLRAGLDGVHMAVTSGES